MKPVKQQPHNGNRYIDPDHYFANLRATVTDPLSEAEMGAIKEANKGCRLIKGQVFLWKEGQSWEDLWDPKGEIPDG